MDINHNSSIPLYIQIKNFVRENIISGEHEAHSRVPSERKLAEQFGVSRLTVTKALKELEQEGFVYAKVGKGTYVAPIQKIDQRLETLTSFTEEMESKQRTAKSRVLSAGIEAADTAVANALQISVGTPVFRLERIRIANDQLIALETSHIVYSLCPQIMENHDFTCESLYKVLEEIYGIQLTIAHQTVESRLATPYEASVLEFSVSNPVLSFSRPIRRRRERTNRLSRTIADSCPRRDRSPRSPAEL